MRNTIPSFLTSPPSDSPCCVFRPLLATLPPLAGCVCAAAHWLHVPPLAGLWLCMWHPSLTACASRSLAVCAAPRWLHVPPLADCVYAAPRWLYMCRPSLAASAAPRWLHVSYAPCASTCWLYVPPLPGDMCVVQSPIGRPSACMGPLASGMGLQQRRTDSVWSANIKHCIMLFSSLPYSHGEIGPTVQSTMAGASLPPPPPLLGNALRRAQPDNSLYRTCCHRWAT